MSLCAVCTINEINTLFPSCKHLCCCDSCASQLKQCPLCCVDLSPDEDGKIYEIVFLSGAKEITEDGSSTDKPAPPIPIDESAPIKEHATQSSDRLLADPARVSAYQQELASYQSFLRNIFATSVHIERAFQKLKEKHQALPADEKIKNPLPQQRNQNAFGGRLGMF